MPKKSAKEREEELKIWESTPVYLTEEGLKKLKDEFDRLKRSLPAITQEVGRTAAYGDRSENAEYKAAKGRLRATQYRMAAIDDQLRKVKVIPSGPASDGKAQTGSTVVVEINGVTKSYRIVGPTEADPMNGRISFESPLGSLLLGHKEGEKVLLKTEAGEREYLIKEVK